MNNVICSNGPFKRFFGGVAYSSYDLRMLISKSLVVWLDDMGMVMVTAVQFSNIVGILISESTGKL